MPPDGAGPVIVMSGGAPRSLKSSGTSSAETGPDQEQASAPSPIAAMNALPKRAEAFQRSPALASSMAVRQGVLDAVGLDRDGGVAVDGEGGLHRVGAHATAPAGVGDSGANSTETLPLATVMETSRSRGTTQKISRHTASAMVHLRASSSEHSKVVAI